MKNVTITISIKVNDDAKSKHHHDNNRQHHATNFSSDEKLPYVKILPNINEYEAHHPNPRDERFFVDYGKDHNAVTAHELIVRDGKMIAIDESTLKGVEGNSAGTTYGTIVLDGNGGLKLFSDRHGRWYPCSVQNGIYTIANAMEDVKKYDL